MKRIMFGAVIFVMGMVLIGHTHPVLAAEIEEEAASDLGGIELLLELGILVFVGGILYNLWSTITLFGGLIGKALRLVGVGIFLFSFEAIDKVLEHFSLDYIEKVLSESGEEIFHDVLKISGLFFIAWGLSRLTKAVKG